MTDLSEARLARTDGDSWGITESVGATALGVAAARATDDLVDEAMDSVLLRAGLDGEPR